jgi:hypothetical protein
MTTTTAPLAAPSCPAHSHSSRLAAKPRTGLGRSLLLCGAVAWLIAAGPGVPGLAQEDLSEAGTIDRTSLELEPTFWVLDFDVIKVRSLTMLEGPRRGEVYWGLLYTVANRTGEDRDTFLSVTATSDHGRQYADVAITDVEEAFERKHGQPLWGRCDLVEERKDREAGDPFYNYTTIADGETRRCVAVLNRFDAAANKIEIQVRGLSNDQKLVELDDGGRAVEERVYVLEYLRAGDEYKPALDSFLLKKKGWKKIQTRVPSQDNG